MEDQPISNLKEIWNTKAEEWVRHSQDPNNYFTRRARVIRDFVCRGLSCRGKALEIGCATGLLSHLLAEIGFDVHGIDISENMILKARGKVNVPHDHFRVCVGEDIPFEPDYFELVTAIGVFPYIKDYASYIQKISRILKQGGYVVASSTNRLSIRNFLNLVGVIKGFRSNPVWRKTCLNLIRTGLWSGGHVDYASSQQAYSSATFDRLFTRNGFVLIDQLNLYAISVLDKEPLNRKGAGSFFARHWCWSHVGMYQKLPIELGDF